MIWENRTISREEEDEYLNGREKRCSRITPLIWIFLELTSDGKWLKGTEWGEKRKGGRIGDEEDAGEWWRHRKKNEHKGGKSNQVVTKFYQKHHSVFLLRFPFYRSKERKLRRGEASHHGGYVPRGWLDWPGWCFPYFWFVYESWSQNRLLDSYARLGTFEESRSAVRWIFVLVLVVGIGSSFTLSSYCFSIL